MSFATTSDNILVQVGDHYMQHISEGILIVTNKGSQVGLEFAMTKVIFGGLLIQISYFKLHYVNKAIFSAK